MRFYYGGGHVTTHIELGQRKIWLFGVCPCQSVSFGAVRGTPMVTDKQITVSRH